MKRSRKKKRIWVNIIVKNTSHATKRGFPHTNSSSPFDLSQLYKKKIGKGEEKISFCKREDNRVFFFFSIFFFVFVFQRTGDLHWSVGKHWQGGTSSFKLFFNLLKRSCSGSAADALRWWTWQLRGGDDVAGLVWISLVASCPPGFPPPVPPFWGWAGPKKWAVEFGSKWTSSRTLPVEDDGDDALVGLKCPPSWYSSLFWYG